MGCSNSRPMGGSYQPALLRALSIGEIFDRAITLLVRNWAPITIIEALALLPSMVLEFIGTVTQNMTLSEVSFFLSFFFGIVSTIAVAKVISEIYRGGDPGWREPLWSALRRFTRGIGAMFLIGFAFFTVAAMLFGLFVMDTVFGFGIVDRVVVVGIVAVVGVFAIITGTMTFLYALNAIAIEDYRAGESVSKALELLSGTEMGKSLAFGLVLSVVTYGGAIANSYLEVGLKQWLHNYPIAAAAAFGLAVVISSITDVLVPVYYFDVRIRRDGYDLQVALDALKSS